MTKNSFGFVSCLSFDYYYLRKMFSNDSSLVSFLLLAQEFSSKTRTFVIGALPSSYFAAWNPLFMLGF